MHQCEVTAAGESTEASSLRLENKGAGAGEDTSSVDDVSPAVSISPGTLLVFLRARNREYTFKLFQHSIQLLSSLRVTEFLVYIF